MYNNFMDCYVYQMTNAVTQNSFKSLLRAQLASLASLSAPRARDSIVALRARSCALRIHLSLFLIF